LFWRTKNKRTHPRPYVDTNSPSFDWPPEIIDLVAASHSIEVDATTRKVEKQPVAARNVTLRSDTGIRSRLASTTHEEQYLAIGKIVSVFLRADEFRASSIADLDRLVIPAVKAGTYGVINRKSQPGVASVPAAVVLWANVSVDVDHRLGQTGVNPLHLDLGDWQSGNIVWLVETAGDAPALKALLDNLAKTKFADRVVKGRGSIDPAIDPNPD
jgi:hemolysin-activating ACP:hemolysin acyltransferase